MSRLLSGGLVHTYQNGATGQLLMVESIGGGVGWLDMDADGFPDVYSVQGGAVRRNHGQSPDRSSVSQCRWAFFQCHGIGGAGRAGLRSGGVAVGDCDGDGFDDVYVTNVGANTLYRNNGDGTFSEMTQSAGGTGFTLEFLSCLGRPER